MFNSHYILGARVDHVDWDQTVKFCLSALQQNKPVQIVTVNGEHLLHASHDSKHKDAINSADLVVPDSTNVMLVSAIKGKSLPCRIPGSELVYKLLPLLNERKSKLFLLGGRGDTPKKAAEYINLRYPNISVGFSNNDPDNVSTSEIIKESGSEVVLVCYGAPAQEYWTKENAQKAGAKLYIGVGGTIDMLAGTLPRSPAFFRKIGLEWLWRLLLQPTRIKRILNSLIVFPIVALLHR